jgi:hypothetical protein
MTKRSETFADRDSGAPAYWSVRSVDGVIAAKLITSGGTGTQ